MCFSGLFGGKKTTNTTQTTALPDVMKNYSYINDLAKTASQRPFQKYGTQASDFVAQINPQQTMGISGINSSVDAYKPYFQNATAATQAGMGPAYEGINNYMSPYIKDVADTTGAMMRQQYEQAQSGALGTAASSGAFGGDRAGIAAANMQQQNQLGYGSTMANIYNQGYTQALGASQADLARQLQGGAQMAGLGAQAQQLGLAGGQAQIAAGSLQQQTEQAGKDAMINQFMQEQGYPFQTAQFLANIYSMTGPAAGSQTTNTQQGSFWSDRRLKHDVQRIGHTDDGQPIYRFKYNGSDQTQIGLMADQVEKHRPDAVGTDPKTGYQYVDYDRATRKADGGGVAGPYQIEIGSSPGGAGYVSQNYVKPSEMLLPDPSWIDSVTQQNEQRKTGLQDFIDNIGGLKDKWNEFQGLYEPKADGGAVDDKKTPQELGYLQPILDAMKPLGSQGLAGASTSSSGSGGGGGGSTIDNIGKIVDTGIKVANFLGFKDGGVAGGRHGYALDGGVHPTHWNPVTQKYEMEPAATEPAPMVAEPTGVVTPVTRPATPMTTSNGVVPHLHPDQQPNRGIPLLTQADYGMSEPEFKNYTSHQYANPAEAAVGANDYYEGAGRGVGDAAAIKNANRVYAGIKSGGEGLAPNELALYQHYKDKGFNDDTQIAGLIGRYNVEAGQGINPNARNTLGGGHGTYGIMQARGDRFEKLAKAGGLSPEMLEAMPVTNPTVSGGGDGQRTPDQQYEGGVKPYDDRNWLGQIFHNNDPKGTMNKDAMLSLMSGVGTMLASPSPFFLPTLGAGLAAGANTYMAREGQRSDITAQNIENLKSLQRNWMDATYNGMTKDSWPEYAAKHGVGSAEIGGTGALVASGKPLTIDEIRGTVVRNGVKIPFMQDYESLQNLVNNYSGVDPSTALGQEVAQARINLQNIQKTGTTYGKDASGNQIPVAVPEVVSSGNVESQREASRAAGAQFSIDAANNIDSLQKDLAMTKEQINLFKSFPAGAFADEKAAVDAGLRALGYSQDQRTGILGSADYATQAQQAIKLSAQKTLNGLSNMPGNAVASEIDQLNNIIAKPSLEPQSIKEILAIQNATQKYQLDKYNGWLKNPSQNYLTYIQNFNAEHPFQKYLEDAKTGMPTFAGENDQTTPTSSNDPLGVR